ncbi:hypothetical protein GCM10023185_45940 [Hymenobacter saemangeumensis]|uniref:Uncharacterized protein n=1 Tax=Hymenobacter saemangeumensis TaxID=1084522 RepID=A0ABP8ISP9_9BACT
MPRSTGPLLCLLSLAALCLACGCRWFETEEQLQQLYNQSDEVFAGQPLAAIPPGEPGMSKRFLGGYDVLLRVTRRLKGQTRRDTLLVLQGYDNCARKFVKGDTVYVFAHTVRHVQALPREDEEDEGEDSYFDEQLQTYYKSGGTFRVKRYQKWARRYPAVATNQCISFTNQHALVPAFFRAKKDK